jgi:hypothetical protein
MRSSLSATLVGILISQFFAFSVYASLPVIDAAQIVQTIKLLMEAKKQYSELKDLSKINNKQYDFLQRNLHGNYGYGKFLNDSNDLHHRQWSNDSWVDVLRESNTGHTSAFTNAQKNYEHLYPVLSSNRIAPSRHKNNLTRTHYEQSSHISRAALAASSYSYDQINQHIKNVHDILNLLEKQPTEKASIDINTRLVAELGFIQIEMLRQQTIQNQIMATRSQGEVNGMSDQAQFLQ